MQLLTKTTVDTIIKNKKNNVLEFNISTDLNKTTITVHFNEDFTQLHFNDIEFLDMDKLCKLKDWTVYYVNDENALKSLHFFSDKTNKVYKLLPTKDYPSFAISSTPMHQITFSSPLKEAQARIELFNPYKQNAVGLDTCFGLGYSANELSKHCLKVHTFEIDENVIELAKINPYSDALKNLKIKLIIGDVFEEIKKFKDETFDYIIHDPPTPAFANLLYSGLFYKELKRVLKKDGKLFHYCPMPNNKVKGRDFTTETQARLEKEGFKIIKYSKEGQGLLVKK